MRHQRKDLSPNRFARIWQEQPKAGAMGRPLAAIDWVLIGGDVTTSGPGPAFGGMKALILNEILSFCPPVQSARLGQSCRIGQHLAQDDTKYYRHFFEFFDDETNNDCIICHTLLSLGDVGEVACCVAAAALARSASSSSSRCRTDCRT